MQKKSAPKKAASKKTAPKSSTRKPASSGKVETLDVNKNTSANIRQIENGYIVSESGYTGKGRNQKYFNREYFSQKNPVSGIKFGKK